MRFSASMVGISSNSLEMTGAPPMLSPAETTNVLFTALRSAAKAAASTAAPISFDDD